MGKPDCERCGFPYHKHNIGSFVFCPIIATYKPKAPLIPAPKSEPALESSTLFPKVETHGVGA